MQVRRRKPKIRYNLPDSQTQTKEWVLATDKQAKKRFNPSYPLENDPFTIKSFTGELTEGLLDKMVDGRRFMCQSHLQLSQEATRLFVDDDFEEKWLALDSSDQEKYFLDSYRAQEKIIIQNRTVLELAEKINCPEICFDQVTMDGGRGFLDLLKIFLLDNNEEIPSQPFNFHNPRFDDIIEWKEDDPDLDRKALLYFRRLVRTSYIFNFVYGIISKYQGREMRIISFTREPHIPKMAERAVDHFLGPSPAGQWLKDYIAHDKEKKLFCSYCLKHEDKVMDGKMSVCSKCAEIGRWVRYCNKDCQKSAWKSHKRECGKIKESPMAFEDILKPPTLSSRPDIPPVEPGFRRSPELLRTITLLSENYDKDYAATIPNSPPETSIIGLAMSGLETSTVFIIMRNRAICSGDLAGILYLYRAFQTFVLKTLGEDGIRNQFRKHYGERFDQLLQLIERGEAPAMPDIRLADVLKTLGHLKQLGRFHKELKDHIPGGKTTAIRILLENQVDATLFAEFPCDVLSPVMVLSPLSSNQSRNKRRKRSKKNQDANEDEDAGPAGPNHPSSISSPLDGVILPTALERQIALIKANPMADYILWGQEDAPDIPHAMTFTDITEAVPFLRFRQRLFTRGGSDFDALIYVVWSLQSAVRRAGIYHKALRKQLGEEYGLDNVDRAFNDIYGNLYVRDGQTSFVGFGRHCAEMLHPRTIAKQLCAAGRFPELLEGLPL